MFVSPAENPLPCPLKMTARNERSFLKSTIILPIFSNMAMSNPFSFRGRANSTCATPDSSIRVCTRVSGSEVAASFPSAFSVFGEGGSGATTLWCRKLMIPVVLVLVLLVHRTAARLSVDGVIIMEGKRWIVFCTVLDQIQSHGSPSFRTLTPDG